MKIKVNMLCILFILTFFSEAFAQEGKTNPSEVFTSIPQGWRFELIPFPLAFAPEINLSGREELLFAPGMYKPEEEDFFSYAFVWQVDGNQMISQANLKQYFYEYYEGLYKAVSGEKESKPVSIELIKQAKEFNGSIDWTEPFQTKQKQKLFVRGYQQVCMTDEVRVVVFVSPQNENHIIWEQMRKLPLNQC